MDAERIEALDELAATIRAERRARNMTQQEFADFLGVTRAYVIKLESGDDTKLRRLVAALEMLGMDLRAVRR
ncbi:MAG: helix-turn-helix transcriptional regulator [Ilumatobacteraceae bacterium]